MRQSHLPLVTAIAALVACSGDPTAGGGGLGGVGLGLGPDAVGRGEADDGGGSDAGLAPSDAADARLQVDIAAGADGASDALIGRADTADDATDAEDADDGAADAAADADAPDGIAVAPCPAGVLCIGALPYVHSGNSAALPPGTIASYTCKAAIDESGPEQLYRFTLAAPAFVSAAVYDGEGVDVDVHLLSAPSGTACVARGDKHVGADLAAGTHWLAVDTYVSGGKAQSGAYTLEVGAMTPSVGACGLQKGVMKRVNDGGKHLAMPAQGPIVLEAHLVTQKEPPPYPMTPTAELAEHYALSQSVTGLVMHRSQPWAPLEGGSHYGAGIGSPTLVPVLDEGWYVNMYWTKESRPPRGTKMILRLPGSDRAVVVSAGHETGPGNLSHIGGTPEETHFYVGTKHLSPMTLGIAVDQGLPFGPRRCVDAAAGAVACDPALHKPVNAGLTEPAGVGKCPPGMVQVEAFCVDRYEAALVELKTGGAVPHSPFHPPGSAVVRAVSLAGAVPQSNISGAQAAKACEAAGKRLCTDKEWLRACRGPAQLMYPYGNTAKPGTCNDHRDLHPVIEYFGTSASWIWSELDHPCINQQAATVAKSGTFQGCVTAEGVHDMMGNLHEWTADPAGTFRGGFYADTKVNGTGCGYVTTAHSFSYSDYSTGFRCCADAAP